MMTFVSSYDDESLYVYFQKPNRMLRINLSSEPEWEIVEPEVYEQCLNHGEFYFSLFLNSCGLGFKCCMNAVFFSVYSFVAC